MKTAEMNQIGKLRFHFCVGVDCIELLVKLVDTPLQESPGAFALTAAILSSRERWHE
jgi:hypothetical protein